MGLLFFHFGLKYLEVWSRCLDEDGTNQVVYTTGTTLIEFGIFTCCMMRCAPTLESIIVSSGKGALFDDGSY